MKKNIMHPTSISRNQSKIIFVVYYKCPNCQQELEAEEIWCGMEVPCPYCKKNIIVPPDPNAKPQIRLTPLTPQFQQPQFTTSTANSRYVMKNIDNNPNLKLLQKKGCFSVYEHQQDLSNSPESAMNSYFMSKMNIRKRQVLIELNGNTIKMQAGAMQWIAGNISCETGLGSGMSAVGGFIKGLAKGVVTGESAVKPLYSGYGHVMLEPTFKYILFEDVSEWGEAGIVLQDSLFLACDACLRERIISRKKLSALLGAGEGIFNLALSGSGIAVLESPVPREEMYEFDLRNDVLKIDGNMAIAWSASLELTVERSSKSLVGSMVNGEGLLNVYRGTGKVLMTPTILGTLMEGGKTEASASSGGSAVKGVLDGIGRIGTVLSE